MIKKILKLTITLAIIALLIIVGFEYKNYRIKFSGLESKFDFNGYELFYMVDDSLEYVSSDEEVISRMKPDLPIPSDSVYFLNDMKYLDLNIDNNCYWHSYYLHSIDKFSDINNVAIYYPLYNRNTKKRESFIILSAGIDGKQDNFLLKSDTLFLDDWKGKLKLYNPNHPYFNVCDSIMFKDKEGEVKFNIIKRFWGNKDHLIQVGRIDFACTNWRARSEKEMSMILKKIDTILYDRKKLD